DQTDARSGVTDGRDDVVHLVTGQCAYTRFVGTSRAGRGNNARAGCYFLIALKGTIDTPVVGASIENRSTVIGEQSLLITYFSEIIFVGCLMHQSFTCNSCN
ncbi:MAG: hypothetical protein RLZZ184_1361, partial [Cyanobacteriota bacterium]